MSKDHYSSFGDVELEPSYLSTDVMRILHASGIRACRERVTRLAGDLFGWPADGTPRRISRSGMNTLREAFTLIDQVGLPRSEVVALYVSGGGFPDNVCDGLDKAERVLTAALSTVEAGRKQFRDSSDPADRIEAAHNIRAAVDTLGDAADSIARVRRLVAA